MNLKIEFNDINYQYFYAEEFLSQVQTTTGQVSILEIDMTEQKYNAADLTPLIKSPREPAAALSRSCSNSTRPTSVWRRNWSERVCLAPLQTRVVADVHLAARRQGHGARVKPHYMGVGCLLYNKHSRKYLLVQDRNNRKEGRSF